LPVSVNYPDGRAGPVHQEMQRRIINGNYTLDSLAKV